MTEDQLRDEYFLFLVKHYRDAVTVVPNFDEVLFRIDRDLDHGHLLVSVVVVRRIYQYFIYKQ